MLSSGLGEGRGERRKVSNEGRGREVGRVIVHLLARGKVLRGRRTVRRGVMGARRGIGGERRGRRVDEVGGRGRKGERGLLALGRVHRARTASKDELVLSSHKNLIAHARTKRNDEDHDIGVTVEDRTRPLHELDFESGASRRHVGLDKRTIMLQFAHFSKTNLLLNQFTPHFQAQIRSGLSLNSRFLQIDLLQFMLRQRLQ